MIDISVLRDDRDNLKASLARRGVTLDVEAMAEIDERRRVVRADAETVRAEQKKSGQAISQLSGDEKDAAIARAGELASEYKEKLAVADDLDEQFEALWIKVPNIAHESAADGFAEEDSAEIKQWGTITDRGLRRP